MLEVSSDARAGKKNRIEPSCMLLLEWRCAHVANYKSHYSPTLMQINKMSNDSNHLAGNKNRKHISET